jgi:hypothetical protein
MQSVAALPAPFKMTRHLLLRQDGEALLILRQLVTDGTISAADLASWPLFDRIREAGLLTRPIGQASRLAPRAAERQAQRRACQEKHSGKLDRGPWGCRLLAVPGALNVQRTMLRHYAL